MNKENTHKKVFISYSWDNVEHQSWVLKLANDLIQNFGVDIILDQYELSPGKDLPHFMESSIEQADKVLVILTPNYKTKAENRRNGVGYETSMISQEIFESPITNIKFIPILRDGNHNTSSPKFLTSKISHDMCDDSKYEFQLFSLAKAIYDNTLLKKPKLGPIPDFDVQESDPIIDIANSLKKKAELHKEIDDILSSQEGYTIVENEIIKLKNLVNEKIALYGSKTDLKFNVKDYYYYYNSFIIYCFGHSVSFYWESTSNNSANDVKILMRFWKGYARLHDPEEFYHPNQQSVLIEEILYQFDLNSKKEPVWKNEKKISTIEELTQSMFTFFIKKIQENIDEKSRDY